jgi:hypothetical protein
VSTPARRVIPAAPAPDADRLIPDDPAQAPLFTAFHVDDTGRYLAHAAGRLRAAHNCGGDERRGHVAHLSADLLHALTAAHRLAANLRRHYPAEGAELDATAAAIGLARALSEPAKAATTAHLTQTVMFDTGHAARHAAAMLVPGGDGALWKFNAGHCGSHLRTAAEHAVKLAEHLRDNYPAEAAHLAGLGVWSPRA